MNMEESKKEKRKRERDLVSDIPRGDDAMLLVEI